MSPSMDGPVRCRVYARIGLLGNPSDGFQGATIAVSLANFWAEVGLELHGNVGCMH